MLAIAIQLLARLASYSYTLLLHRIRYTRAAEKIGNFYLKILARSLNFGVNSNQCPQGCRMIRVSKFSGIYGKTNGIIRR